VKESLSTTGKHPPLMRVQPDTQRLINGIAFSWLRANEEKNRSDSRRWSRRNPQF
jgi:hypothetical protein